MQGRWVRRNEHAMAPKLDPCPAPPPGSPTPPPPCIHLQKEKQTDPDFLAAEAAKCTVGSRSSVEPGDRRSEIM